MSSSPPPLRVLQALTIMNRGGAETMVMNYYRNIDRSQLQFDFLVHRPERGAYDDEIEAMGGKIYRIPPLFQLCEHRQAVRQFFAEHSDYRVIHGHVGELGYFLYKEARKHHCPCVIAHAHNAACDKNWKLPFRHVLKHLIRPQCTHAMTCGKEAAQWLFGDHPKTPVLMINNAINASTYRFSEETRQRVRHELGWDQHWVIGDVARFFPPKNHAFLLKLFREVLRQRPEALLVLIGAPSGLYEEVRQQATDLGIADKVQFLGMRTDIPDLLQGMDVYCSPSLYEGLSVSMVEAQASGLRIVTSDQVPRQVALCPELLDFIPLRASIETWINAVLRPYERRDTYAGIAGAGFDIVQNAQKLQQFYLQHASA